MVPDEGVHVELFVLDGSPGDAPASHCTQLAHSQGLQPFRIPTNIKQINYMQPFEIPSNIKQINYTSIYTYNSMLELLQKKVQDFFNSLVLINQNPGSKH